MAKAIAEMSLAEKVGQLFILAFPGRDYSKAAQLIRDYHISGCYISQENAETFAQARELSQTLQAAAQADIGLPLILGVDQEGAWGVLLPEASIGPGNLALGRAKDTAHTEKIYALFAREMGAVGYNTILGPCSDVNLDPRNPIIGTRSFGEEARKVSVHVRAAVKAIKQHGVLCAAKHFPGHGDTHSDTHRELPQVDKPLKLLSENELLPFQAAVDAGVDLVMTSHILYPQLDAEYPATLSWRILRQLLRRDMGFEGVIITDSMNMGAMRKFYSPEEATVRALLAGADLIMLSEEHYDHSPAYWEKQQASMGAVVRAVEQGRISESQLDEKLERILHLKRQIPREEPRDSSVVVPVAEGPQIELAAARAAIEVLRDRSALLPLRPSARVALLNATPRSAYRNLTNARGIGPNQQEAAFDAFATEFCRLWPQSRIIDYEAVASDFVCDVLIAVTEDHPLPGEDFDKSEQLARIRELQGDAALRPRLLVLALRSPYDLPEFPELPAYVCAYSGRTCSARAAAQFLSRCG